MGSMLVLGRHAAAPVIRTMTTHDHNSTTPLTGLSILPPGESPPVSGGVVFRAFDPSRGADLPTEFRAATAAEVDRAGWQAWQAFYSTQERPGRDRAEMLDQAARYLADRTPQILSVV